MKIPFRRLFYLDKDSNLTALLPITIGNFNYKKGTCFEKGLAINNIDISKCSKNFFVVEFDSTKGYYKISAIG